MQPEPSLTLPPVSPFTVRITIGGQDWRYVRRRLEELAFEAQRREPAEFQMCGGGAGGNYSVTTSTRDITPEKYEEELQAWSARNREARLDRTAPFGDEPCRYDPELPGAIDNTGGSGRTAADCASHGQDEFAAKLGSFPKLPDRSA
jgi:hypothetical protein